MKIDWPDLLLLMAGALRSGLSLDEAINFSIQDGPSTLREKLIGQFGADFHLMPSETKINRLFSDPNLSLARAALLLSHQTGAEQAKILETCARLLREKHEFSERVKAMTVQGRLTAWVVGASPLALIGGIQMVSPDLVQPLFKSTIGIGILFFSVASIAVGIYFVHQVAKVEP